VVLQLLQVAQRGKGTFAAEAVQAPEHDQVKLLLICFEQQRLELGAVSLSPRLLVGEHLIDGAMLLSEGAQLVQLVFGVLASVLGRHAGIDSYSHTRKYFSGQPISFPSY